MSTLTKKQLQTEDQWRAKLTPAQYEVMRKKGTEMPFTGLILYEERDGTYACAACGNQLFSADAKFNSGTGWPSFDRAIPDSVTLREDHTEHMARMEVLCAECDSHLGHVFPDGPTETGDRYCMNSVSLTFTPER